MAFHLTQILTGHGCFRSYLKRIRVYESAECTTYPETDEDVGHALFFVRMSQVLGREKGLGPYGKVP